VVAFDNFQVNAGMVTCPQMSPPQVSVGARVETTTNLFVRGAPSNFVPLLGTAFLGSVGTVIGGPVDGDCTDFRLRFLVAYQL